MPVTLNDRFSEHNLLNDTHEKCTHHNVQYYVICHPLLQPFTANQNQSSSTSADAQTDGAGNKPHPPNEANSTKKSSGKKHSNSSSPSPSGKKKRRPSRDSNENDGSEKKSGEPSIFTFDTSQLHPSQHVMPPPPVLGGATQDAGTMTGAVGGAQEGNVGVSGGGRVGSKGATLDDLCRAVEALEKMENGGGGGGARREEDEDKRRPGNIHIPAHTSPSLERHRLGSSPPYTPPPILSPARSMAMLATVPGTMFVHTYIHTYIHTHTYIHIHTYTYIHTYIHTCSGSLFPSTLLYYTNGGSDIVFQNPVCVVH